MRTVVRGVGGAMEEKSDSLDGGSADHVVSGSMVATDMVDEQLQSPDRVTMLSDGVFAIVLTILVLEIKVPGNLTHASLSEAFHELRPTLVAWIISFLITGMYWVGHRDIFARV